jgi:choline-glycine betaine transporter
MKDLLIDPGAYPKQPAGSKAIFMKDFIIIENILRNRNQFLAEISQGTTLREKIRAMLVASFAFMAVYGALLGSTHSLWQTLSSAAKLPLLFLATLVICAPALYILNILFGLNQSLSQSVTLVLMAISVTAILLLSFASITLFFILTVPDHYQFFKLLNVFFFIIAGSIGASFLSQGIRVISTSAKRETKTDRMVFYLWIVLYTFVGSQMAWTLRPFVGYPNAPFELFRQIGGNFYADILASIGEILGFFIVK